MVVVLMFWLGLSVALAMLAKNRGRRAWLWFILAMALTPLLAFAILMMLADLTEKEYVETMSQSLEASHVRCPHCAEYVRPEAVVCKFCHQRLAPQDPLLVEKQAQERINEGLEEIKARELNIIISGGVALGFAFIVWLAYEFL